MRKFLNELSTTSAMALCIIGGAAAYAMAPTEFHHALGGPSPMDRVLSIFPSIVPLRGSIPEPTPAMRNKAPKGPRNDLPRNLHAPKVTRFASDS